MENPIDQKPSETAFFAALRRSIAHKSYHDERLGPDQLAGIFLPPHFRFFLKFKRVRENTREKLDGFLPGLTEYMIARTAYFDRLFKQALVEGVPQIVLLGAGYDTRAFRYAQSNQGTTIFELDAAPTQERKVECIRKARLDVPQKIKFIPINFNKETIEDVLKKAGFRDDEKTLFIWEGVSYYLEAGAVDETLALVTHHGHPETAIAFDYTVKVPAEKAEAVYGAKAFAATMAEHHESEALLFSLSEGEIEIFLAQRGLKMIEHLNNDEIEQHLLLGNNGKLIGPITGHFRFVHARKA